MCKFNPKNNSRFIDPCMKEEIKKLKEQGSRAISCCCGHGKYEKTIILRLCKGGVDGGMEYFTGIFIPRKRRFYKKDKQGVYFIPEVCSEFKRKK